MCQNNAKRSMKSYQTAKLFCYVKYIFLEFLHRHDTGPLRMSILSGAGPFSGSISAIELVLARPITYNVRNGPKLIFFMV